MRHIRKEDLSLYYYIKDVVLEDFVELEENITLEYMPEISSSSSYVYRVDTDMLPSPTERGRGWVYFDEDWNSSESGVSEQVNRVTLYDSNANVISGTEYMIDYLDGRIVTSGTCSPDSVDYYWNYVSVVDEWAAIEASDPPVIVIDVHGTDKMGYQLGSGKKVIRKVDIHIFASNTAERNDLVDTIYDGLYLKSTPLYDFPNGTVLDYDGTWYGRRSTMNRDATLFDTTRVTNVIGNIEFDKVTSRNVSLPLLMTRSRDEVMLSDLNAYRSKISFDMVYYTYSL